MPHLLAGTALVSTALVVATLVAGPTTTVHAAAETCDGKPATIVITTSGTYQGTSGDDVIVVVPPTFAYVDGLEGDDTICGAYDTKGGPGNDDLWSGFPATQEPLEYFNAYGVHGGPGDDVIHGDDHSEALFGDDGNDTIYGNGGNDILQGDRERTGEGDGVPGNDTLDGGAGDDTVVDSPGDDTMRGGAGDNVLALGLSGENPGGGCTSHPETPTLDVAAGTVIGLGNDTFDGFRTYDAEGYADATLLGTAGPDRLTSGHCGKAEIFGRGGKDLLSGATHTRVGGRISAGGGDDRIILSAGAYDVSAGSGDDKIHLDNAGRSRLDGGHGTDWLLVDSGTYAQVDLRGRISRGPSSSSEIRVSGFENARLLRATNRPAVISGTAGPNVLVGPTNTPVIPETSKVTVLRGRGGNDRLIAHAHDTAYGGPGHDYCRAPRTVGCEAP